MVHIPDTAITIIVDPGLPVGLLANTVAALAVGIGAPMPHLAGAELVDGAGRSVRNSANRAVPILQAGPDALTSLLLKALPAPEAGVVVPFPRFARAIHGFEDYRLEFAKRDLASEPIDGLGLAAPKRWVKSLTGNLKLLR
jgi:hypothetical protein